MNDIEKAIRNQWKQGRVVSVQTPETIAIYKKIEKEEQVKAVNKAISMYAMLGALTAEREGRNLKYIFGK